MPSEAMEPYWQIRLRETQMHEAINVLLDANIRIKKVNFYVLDHPEDPTIHIEFPGINLMESAIYVIGQRRHINEEDWIVVDRHGWHTAYYDGLYLSVFTL